MTDSSTVFKKIMYENFFQNTHTLPCFFNIWVILQRSEISLSFPFKSNMINLIVTHFFS